MNITTIEIKYQDTTSFNDADVICRKLRDTHPLTSVQIYIYFSDGFIYNFEHWLSHDLPDDDIQTAIHKDIRRPVIYKKPRSMSTEMWRRYKAKNSYECWLDKEKLLHNYNF